VMLRSKPTSRLPTAVASASTLVNSMPLGLRWFAEHQPFAPFTETVRGFLTGTDIGASATASIIWCLAIGLVDYLTSRAL
jgi:ABC-2 type transport system permease protein